MTRKKVRLDNLPSNNLTAPNEEETQIISGTVKTKRGGGLARNVRNIGNSLFEEIIMPSIKSAIVDFFSHGVKMMMFGEDTPSRSRLGGQPQPYNQRYRQRSQTRSRSPNRNVIRQTEEIFEDIFFENRNDAQLVLGRMMELIAEYGKVTMGDLHSLVGLGQNITHEGWGWDNLSGVRVQFSSEGYVIDFPEPIYFN